MEEIKELKPNTGPLAGLKVLDLTRVLSGPFAAMWLASMGADVIKIENPKDPDVSRAYYPVINGQSGYYSTMNRNKRSITLNLKSEEGKKLFLELAKDADAVIENFRPGVMDKLGVGYEELKKVNPGIVYASISGYGTYGPYSKKPGYDVVAQAMSGLMAITGFPEGPPTRVGSSIGDTVGGVSSLVALLAALYCKSQTGLGQKVEVALVDSLLALSTPDYVRYFLEGLAPVRMGNYYRSWAPYGTYQAKDGYYNIGCGTDEFFYKFARAMGHPEMVDDARFRTHADRVANLEAMDAVINEWAMSRSVKEVCAIIDEAGVPCAPVYTIKELEKDEHIAGARDMFPTINQPEIGEFRITNIPLRFAGTGLAPIKAAPGLGANNEEIYGALGYAPEELARLREQGVI